LAELAAAYDFAFFEHWLTDYVGHRGDLAEGCRVLERFDAVLGGLLNVWDEEAGLIVITSDHGNLEDLSHRHHTLTTACPHSSSARRAAALLRNWSL
jgi:2,3-bisphosphoglycerate-independent phosphoglycerate mutase